MIQLLDNGDLLVPGPQHGVRRVRRGDADYARERALADQLGPAITGREAARKWDEGQHPRVPAGQPEGGQFADTGEVAAAITSNRPAPGGRTQAEVLHDAETLRRTLARAPGVEVLDVQPTRGVWGGEAEPSVWVRLRGPDSAVLPILARQAAAWDQDAVLIGRVAPGDPQAEPRYTWDFGRALGPAQVAALEAAAKRAGLPGWAIEADRGRLHVQTIPSFQSRHDTMEAAGKLTAELGDRARLQIRPVRVTMLSRSDDYGGWTTKAHAAPRLTVWRHAAAALARSAARLSRRGSDRGPGGGGGGDRDLRAADAWIEAGWLDDVLKVDEWVDTTVARFATRWGREIAGVDTTAGAVAAWKRLLPDIRTSALHHLTGDAANPAVEHIAEGLFDTFIGGLADRRIAPAVSASSDPLATIIGVPSMLGAALAWVTTRVRAFESLRGQALAKAEGDPASELLPEGITGNQRYRIVTAGDNKVCDVCAYMEALSGSFRLTDAVATFDNYLQAFEDGALDTAIEGVGIPKFEDVDGLGVTALASLGWDLPPLHPRCRCSVVLV